MENLVGSKKLIEGMPLDTEDPLRVQQFVPEVLRCFQERRIDSAGELRFVLFTLLVDHVHQVGDMLAYLRIRG